MTLTLDTVSLIDHNAMNLGSSPLDSWPNLADVLTVPW